MSGFEASEPGRDTGRHRVKCRSDEASLKNAMLQFQKRIHYSIQQIRPISSVQQTPQKVFAVTQIEDDNKTRPINV